MQELTEQESFTIPEWANGSDRDRWSFDGGQQGIPCGASPSRRPACSDERNGEMRSCVALAYLMQVSVEDEDPAAIDVPRVGLTKDRAAVSGLRPVSGFPAELRRHGMREGAEMREAAATARGASRRSARTRGKADIGGRTRGAQTKERTRVRTVPRLALGPRSAACVILVLVLALATSLTLLVIQTSNQWQFDAYASRMVAEGKQGNGGPGRTAATPRASRKPGGPTSAGEGRQSEGERESSGSSPGSPQNAGPSGAAQEGARAENGTGNGTGQTVAQGTGPRSPQPDPCAGGICADGKVNLNAASSEQLQTVPGIGPSTAGKILEYRRSHGRFSGVDELSRIQGIGQKTLAKLRGSLVAR